MSHAFSGEISSEEISSEEISSEESSSEKSSGSGKMAGWAGGMAGAIFSFTGLIVTWNQATGIAGDRLVLVLGLLLLCGGFLYLGLWLRGPGHARGSLSASDLESILEAGTALQKDAVRTAELAEEVLKSRIRTPVQQLPPPDESGKTREVIEVFDLIEGVEAEYHDGRLIVISNHSDKSIELKSERELGIVCHTLHWILEWGDPETS
jgi:hypothetical protein